MRPVNARDDRVHEVLDLAAQSGCVVLHHAWYKTVGHAFNESNPSDMAHLASEYPSIPIVMAHLTGAGVRGVNDVAPYPNLLVDTSGSQPASGMVEYAVDNLGPHRLVFGSDAAGRDFSVQMARVTSARISQSAKKLILGGNAARLLGPLL